MTTDPLSMVGHAALSIKGSDNSWIAIQSNTFLNWVNQSLHYKYSEQKIDDITTGFSNGVSLVYLVECLQQRRLPRVKENPINQHQCMENVTIALKALADDQVKLVNIGSADIVSGNVKLILGLLWHLILKYQIGKSGRGGSPPKKLMLLWLREVLPDCSLHNFTNDWNNGVALHALIDFCSPGLSPNWRDLNVSNGLENCRLGMKLANDYLNVPQIMAPEDLHSSKLDELSCMTYLSYFMRTKSPGYLALLKWVNHVLLPKGRHVDDFSVSWQDGRLLMDLVAVIFKEEPSGGNSVENILESVYAVSLRHEVEPILTVSEMTSTDIDPLGLMVYVSRLRNAATTLLVDTNAKPIDVVDAAVPLASLKYLNDEKKTAEVGQVCVLRLSCPSPVEDKSSVAAQIITPRRSALNASITWLNDQTAHISFIANESGEHSVTIEGLRKPDGQQQLVLPLLITVKRGPLEALRVFVPDGLRLGHPVEVRVDARACGSGELRAELHSPSGRQSELPIQEISLANYSIKFIANEPDDWFLHLWFEDNIIPGSPFRLPLISSGQVRVLPPSLVSLNTVTTIRVDLSSAGQAELQHRIIRLEPAGSISVPSQLTTKDATGHSNVIFTPEEPGLYHLYLTYAGEDVRGSPFAFNVVDASRVRCSGDDLRFVQVGFEATFQVDCANAGLGDLLVSIKGPNDEVVLNKCFQTGENIFAVNFTPTTLGVYHIDMRYAGQAIPGNPFEVFVCDVTQAMVNCPQKVNVGCETQFTVNLTNAGECPLNVVVKSPTGDKVHYKRSKVETCLHPFTFTPEQIGTHEIVVCLGVLPVKGSPFKVFVQSIKAVSAHGPGIICCLTGSPTTFVVDSNGDEGDLIVKVEGPDNFTTNNIIERKSDGNYCVSYTPQEVGRYYIHVIWNGKVILGSPFSCDVLNINEVRCLSESDLTETQGKRLSLKVGEKKRLVFGTAAAGPGVLTAEVSGPSGLLPVSFEVSDEQTVIMFTPEVVGEYALQVWWADFPLPHSPFRGTAENFTMLIDSSKIILSGRGIKEARVNEEVDFYIDGSEVGNGKPTITMSSIYNTLPVYLTHLGANRYRCTYTPESSGAYLLEIMWNEQKIRGSPFKVSVLAMADAAYVVCSGEGLRMGIIGQEIKSLIDTRRAGPGELTATCMGPKKVAYCELYDHRDATFTLNIKPQESGRHILDVKYSNAHVPGSPFILRVSAAPDASKVRVLGPGIEHGVLSKFQSRFICETRGAGAGQLTVRIRGPKGAFRVEMQRESQKDRTILCRYDPIDCGEYVIDVKWSGVHVSGSPFVVHIVDSQEALEEVIKEKLGYTAVLRAIGNQQWKEDI